MLSKQDYQEIKELLTPHKKIVITTHRSPDGDAIGSSLAMYHVLKSLNCAPVVIVPNEYPTFLKWMDGEENIINYEKNKTEAATKLAEAELIFCLDYNILSRMGDLAQEVEKHPNTIKIMIDHHPQPSNDANYLYSDVSASSTGQLVYEFILGLGAKDKITKAVAACIYTGIMTDTGSFRFSSTSPRTHIITADLMEVGLETSLVHNHVYDTNSENRLKLLGYCLSEKMVVLSEFKTAYISLSYEELKRYNYQTGDTEGVVNYALSIDGVKFAAIIKENQENVRMSFRSKGKFSANQFARDNFEGGGHLNAAGGKSDIGLTDTINKFVALLPNYKTELNEI